MYTRVPWTGGEKEYGWFCETFGRAMQLMASIEADDAADMQAAPGESTADILAFYARARAAADAAIDEIDIETLGTSWDGNTLSMRWVLIHMIEETARHAGHMDIVRELIDGTAGDYDRD